MPARFSIAHVTPYPWEEANNEVNAHVRAVSEELSRRGHRVLVLAPSRSQELVRASRRALRAARGDGQRMLEGSDGGAPAVVAVGEVLDVPGGARRRPPALPIDVARTIEELLGVVELDFVHVHEPFAPSTSNAALRHSRALNVGSFHASSERLLSTLLARLLSDRGVKMLRTSQLNVGGNMDFYNMLERERLESKKISKTNAVTSIMDEELPADDIYIGPSDYVPWLGDRKWAHIRVEGQAFGDVALNLELKLEVWDSPNSAGIVIDAVRCCKLALNNGLGGQLDGPSSYLMKSPQKQRPDEQARADTEKFIAKYSRTPAGAAAAGAPVRGARARAASGARRAAKK